jgi:plasmid maintenance system antidote protein VapI
VTAEDWLTPLEDAAVVMRGDPPQHRRCVACGFVVWPRGGHQVECPVAGYLAALEAHTEAPREGESAADYFARVWPNGIPFERTPGEHDAILAETPSEREGLRSLATSMARTMTDPTGDYRPCGHGPEFQRRGLCTHPDHNVADAAFNPDWVIHPGETLREWREENHLAISAAAMACARMPVALYERVEAGSEPISETIASALAHGTGISKTFWLNLERNFRAGLAAGKTWTR